MHTKCTLRHRTEDGSVGSIDAVELDVSFAQTMQLRGRAKEDPSFHNDERNANARRLVACWNACNGIPTEDLIKHENDPTPVFSMLMETWKQRDELLTAMKRIGELSYDSQAMRVAWEAIDKVEKKVPAQHESRPCYSEDGETFRDGDLVEALRNSDAAVPGRTIYLGKSDSLDVAGLFSTESILERMSEMACDEVGDAALGDWPNHVSDAAVAELEAMLVRWAEKNVMADAPYRVVDVVEHVVTEDDLKMAGVEFP